MNYSHIFLLERRCALGVEPSPSVWVIRLTFHVNSRRLSCNKARKCCSYGRNNDASFMHLSRKTKLMVR